MIPEFTDKQLMQILNNVIVTSDGFKLFQYLLEQLQAFDRGVNLDNERLDFKNRIIREQGLKLLDMLFEANMKKAMEIIKERNKQENDNNRRNNNDE